MTPPLTRPVSQSQHARSAGAAEGGRPGAAAGQRAGRQGRRLPAAAPAARAAKDRARPQRRAEAARGPVCAGQTGESREPGGGGPVAVAAGRMDTCGCF